MDSVEREADEGELWEKIALLCKPRPGRLDAGTATLASP